MLADYLHRFNQEFPESATPAETTTGTLTRRCRFKPPGTKLSLLVATTTIASLAAIWLSARSRGNVWPQYHVVDSIRRVITN